MPARSRCGTRPIRSKPGGPSAPLFPARTEFRSPPFDLDSWPVRRAEAKDRVLYQRSALGQSTGNCTRCGSQIEDTISLGDDFGFEQPIKKAIWETDTVAGVVESCFSE